MRKNTWVIAFIASGVSLGACKGAVEPPMAEPATAQVSQSEPEKPLTPEAPSEPAVNRLPSAPSEVRGPVDRSEALQSTLAHMERGDFGQAFKYLAAEVVWTEVGLPNGELDSVPELISYQERSRTGFSEFRIKASRILESADYQVVEFVWAARHTGAFADGTAATNKVAVLPGAMLLRYQGNGLVDRVWVFQDWTSVLQQLGLAADLPRDFKPSSFPGETEVIIGRYEPILRERYESFVAKLGRDDFQATLAARTTPDFAWTDLGSGQLVSGHDGSNSYFAQRQGRFARERSVLEAAVGAGPFFAAYVTNTLVYQGGYLGVPGSDQSITTHTLDIVRFDADNTRLVSLVSYGNSYEIMAALGITAGAAPRPEAKDGRFAITACDDYVTHMRACLDSLPAETREATRAVTDAQILEWQKQHRDLDSRAAVEKACQQTAAQARLTYASACPRVEWE